MGRASRSFFFTVLFIFLLGAHPVVSRAETAPSAELESILRNIESRHYRWIAIRADVLLFFAKTGDPSAMCGGELLYQRLEERMFLTCVDTRQELMFIFRTFDRRFDLYLPARKTVYHGSIFDMEDSPDIESHLKARDLYRALKPLAVDPRRTKVERTNSAITSLDVYGRNESEGSLVRKLYLTPEGDVRGEIFYDPGGRSVTEVQRYDFQEIRGQAGAYASIIFPKKITIMSPETKKGSAIFFSRVKALDTVDPLDFILRTPSGTQEVFLDEKDPRTPASKKSSGSPAAAVPPPKEVPVYLAKPWKTSAKRTVPVKETVKKPEVVTPQAPASVAASAPVATVKETSPDADLAVEDTSPPVSPPSSSSSADAQTTLDPSVEPSLDMGKR